VVCIARGIPDPAYRDELSATIENLSDAFALRSQEADVHDDTAETRRKEGNHDSSCGCKRLPYLVRSDQSERIYAMRAEGTEPSSLIAGEKTGLKRSSAPSSPKVILMAKLVCQCTGHRVHDFAISFKSDEAPQCSDAV
jgi:hypothetical protein